MTGKELREYIPHMPIERPDDDCICSKRGDITFGWRVYLPVAYTVNEEGYDSIISSFQQAYRLLPSYCVVHKQDIFKFDTYHAEKRGEFLMDCYEKNFEGRKYLNGYSYIFLTFSSKSVIEMKTESAGLFHIFSSKAPKEDHIRACASIASQFESVLGNNPFLELEALKASDFVSVGEHGEDRGLIPDYLNFFSDTPNLNYDLEFGKSYMTCGELVAKAWFVEDSDSYPGMVCSVVPVSSMSTGASDVYLSGGSPIGYQMRIPHIVNRYIVTLPRKSVEAELNQKKKLMTSFSLYSPSCRVNAEELDTYLDTSAREGTTTIKCFTDIIAWGKSSEIGDIRNNIVTAFSDLDISVCEEMRVMPALHYAGIPGAAAELGFDFYMTSEMNAFLCHGLWDGYDFGMKDGAIKVSDRRRMIPMNIDAQSVARNLGYINDLNLLVVGPSGSGKSFTMNHLITNLYVAGQHGLIIDVGDSYQGQFQVINEETGGKDGIYNTYDPNNPLSFNPFKGRQHWDEVDEEGDKTSSGFDYVMSLIETMYEPKGGWTKELTGILENLVFRFFSLWDNGYPESLVDDLKEAFVNVKRARAHKNKKSFDESKAEIGFMNPLPEIFSAEKRSKDPIFDDFYEYITLVVGPLIKDENFKIDNSDIRPDMFDVDAFGVAISKYRKEGIYGFLLNAEEEKDIFSSRLTCYEVDQIKDNKDLFPLWLLSIMHSFEEKMRSLPCPKFIVIEEAWSAIAKPTMANFIVWLWRTARKFKTSAIVVTQSLSDLTGSPIIKDAIILNTSTKILLDQSKNANNFEKSAETLAFNPMDVGLVLSVNKDLNPKYKYKEAFFAIGEHYSNVFGIEVSLEQALAYESDKTLKKPLFDLAEKKGSMIEAIKEMAQNIRKNKNN